MGVSSLLIVRQFLQLCAQPDEVFFQLREELFLIVELKIECLPELRLHPAAQGRLEGGVQRLHHVFQVHAGLRPADVGLFPGRDVVAGQIVLHLGFDDTPSAAGGLQKVAHLPFPADLLRQRVEGADQRFGVVDGAVVLGEEGAVVPLLLHGGQPQHRQMAHLPDAGPAIAPGHDLRRLAPVKENRSNCPFLTENHCAIHDAEPLVCALYPLAQEISREGQVSYFLQPTGCGGQVIEARVQDYLSRYDVPAREALDVRWALTCMELEDEVERLEAVLSPVLLRRAQAKLWQALYYHYDYAQPWLPQLEANLHGLKADWAKLTAYQQKQNVRSK